MNYKLKRLQNLILKHLPEILTGVSFTCLIIGDYFLVKAAKGDKKTNYILPVSLHSVSLISMVLSNRVSNMQKLSILAAASTLALDYKNYRRETMHELDPKKIVEIDKVEEYKDETEKENKGKELFYNPQYGIKWWSTFSDMYNAELQAQKLFTHYGSISLHDILMLANVDITYSTEEIARLSEWEYDYDNDSKEEMQSLVFDYKSGTIDNTKDGYPCNYLIINVIGHSYDYFWDHMVLRGTEVPEIPKDPFDMKEEL